MNLKSLFIKVFFLLLAICIIVIMITYSMYNYVWEVKLFDTKMKMMGRRGLQVLYSRTNTKQKHIYLMRAHKCGSALIYSIFLRFGYLNNLTFILPARNPYSGTISGYPFQKGKGYFLPPPKGEHFDILCYHTKYDRKGIEEVLPKDTVYIGLVREPLPRFVSAFIYYKHVAKLQYLKDIPGRDTASAISLYLNNPEYYESRKTEEEWSYTRNSMAYDFGFPSKDMKNVSTERVGKFIKKLDAEFDFVIVLEHLDESLVMMKRILNWSMKDILYLGRTNAAVINSTLVINFLSHEDKVLHKNWESIDFALYNHFKKKLLGRLRNEGDLFHREVDDFKATRYAVAQFCSSPTIDDKPLSIMTNSNGNLTIASYDCKMLSTIGTNLTKLIKKRKKYGNHHM